MNKFDYKKLFQQNKSFFKRKPFDISEAPRKDWQTAFIVFTIVNIISLILSGYIFFRVIQGDIFAATLDTNTALSTINRKDLGIILSSFNDRQERFDELRNKSPQTIDPAL